MPLVWLLVTGAVVVLVAFAALRRSRARQIARFRVRWGAPVERTRRFELLLASHAARVSVLGGRSLDDRTWRDLDLDAVFAAIDRTESTLGQHALYHRLRSVPMGQHLQAFDALVHLMSSDEAARERAQLALARLQDPHGYDVWWLGRAGAVERRSWFAVFPMLTGSAALLAALAPFLPWAVMPLVAVLILNIAVRYATDGRIGHIARSFRQCAPLIATAESLRFLDRPDIDPIVGALRTEVPSLARLKLISRWVNGDPFMLSVSPSPLAIFASDVVQALYEYLNLAFLLDATGVYFGVRILTHHGGGLVRVAAAAGEVDAALSIASYRTGRQDWCRPTFRTAGATAEYVDLRHPLLEDAVPNSLELRPGRGVLVTGSNMSGKSTFLRTVGVNTVLAQTIDTCLAREYRAPVFHVRSCIGRGDDLVSGKSYYLAEVQVLLDLVRASEAAAPHLFLLDELFRGTNAIERIAAGQAVLLELVTSNGTTKPHVVLAATHDGELVHLTSQMYEAYHFGDAVEAGGLSFDHRLRPGAASTRNAIALLRWQGAPEGLLASAVTVAEMLDKQREVPG